VRPQTANIKKATAGKRTAKSAAVKRTAVQQVIPLANGWVVKSADTKRFTIITDSRKEAVAVALSIAKTRKTDLVIYGKDGRVVEQRSFAASA
jgi:hypothetical protein